MRIQTCITRRTCQLFVVFIANVTACSRIFIALGKAKVYYIDDVLLLTDTDKEVVGLDITMQEPALVYKLYTL